MYKLLLIDDNEDIQNANREYLARKGYTVDTAYTGMEAVAKLNRSAYDCILLDVMLPDFDGFSICEAARRTIRTPIIFLSAMGSEEDRVKGLMAGGDDYISKPYSLKELGARVYAQIRRGRIDEEKEGVGLPTSVMLDSALRTITIHGTNIILTGKEYRLLSVMVKEPGRIFTLDDLLDQVWGTEVNTDDTKLRMTIRRVRAKLHSAKAGDIDNVFGEGYRYLPPGGPSE